jgi:uncharacterized protein YjbI with pentapeptide repeats
MLDMGKVKPIKKRIASVWAWMIVSPIRFFIVAIAIFFPLILGLDLFWFKDGDDFKNVLVEAHGLIFDLVVFGIILALYEHYRQLQENSKNAETAKQQRIERYLEEIDDLRTWDEKEATYRIVGLLRRLNKEGVSEIPLHNCYLKNADLSELNLSKADLSGSFLLGANLSGTNLSGANLSGANLMHSFLTRTNLSGAYLIVANLELANLASVDLSEAFLGGANLAKAQLININLAGVDIVSVIGGDKLANSNIIAGSDLVGLNLTEAYLNGVIFTGFKSLTYKLLSTTHFIENVVGIPEDILAKLKQEKPEILGFNKE